MRNTFSYNFGTSDVYLFKKYMEYEPIKAVLSEYEFLPAKDQKWIAQAPPGRERLMEYSSKLKKYVRVERIKK